LQGETHVIPIAFVNVFDPVGAGFVSNLARTGGNLTGLLQYEEGIIGKGLSFLKESADPRARYSGGRPQESIYGYFVCNAAVSLALELVPTAVENDGDIGASFADNSRVDVLHLGYTDSPV